MMITTILFDLDGTLLPMNQDDFANAYVKGLAMTAAPAGYQSVCGYEPKAKELIMRLTAKGYRIALATNPLFPTIATESRIRWAGLEPSDFESYTTFEGAHYCKANPNYYKELLEQLHLMPEECLMVGNDVDDDMVAEQLGMKVFLLTDCLINKNSADISIYPHGNYDDLNKFIDRLDK